MNGPICIGIDEYKKSDGSSDLFVFIARGDRRIHTNKYSEKYINRADYEVAELKHVLLGHPKPDLMDPKYADPKE